MSAATSPVDSVPGATSSPVASGGEEQRTPRTLILCFDGTANQYDGENTNVVKFYSLLKKDDDYDQQLCYYQPGIGTYFNPGVVAPLCQWAAKILDEAFAWYLDEHVRGGYDFLMQNYVPGDKICIFGFSRGAYTARALAGLLHKIGLLPKDNPEQVPFAYNLYKNTDAESVTLAQGFKQTFCRDVQIEFVGVWETVASVGVIMTRTLPFTDANTTIKTFRHALSLDEHRVKFQPNLYDWNSTDGTSAQSSPAKAMLPTGSTSDPLTSVMSQEKATAKPPSVKRRTIFRSFLRRFASKSRKNKNLATVSLPKVRRTLSQVEVDVEAGAGVANPELSIASASISSVPSNTDDRIAGGTDVLEVWFAGCHSDVGGGSVSDSTKLSLADVTLRWMIREVFLAQCGVTFDEAAIMRANIPESIFQAADGTTTTPPPSNQTAEQQSTAPVPIEAVNLPSQLDPATPNPNQSANPGPEAPTGPSDGSGSDDPLDVEIDALQPIHDELKIDPLWWVLEVIPQRYQVQESNGKTMTKWWIHLGRGRQLPDSPKFHISVKERMEDQALKYTPRAKWTAGTETYVQ